MGGFALNQIRPWHWLGCLALLIAAPLLAQERNIAVGSAGTKSDGQRRVALVIGNGAYADSPLKNPLNDARAMATALRELGFEVIARENANLRQMDDAVREFGRRLERAHAGLFYYAGHGMQIKGRNFLIPVGANFEHEDEVAYRSLDAGQVLDKMDSAKTKVNLIILDACRNNPFHRAFRARRQGLAEMEAPAGTLVAFATAPGSVASDGEGAHGVYTKHLLKQMNERGLPVEQAFKRVRIGVVEETGERQIPWESSSLRDDFQFRPAPAQAAVAEAALELAFWDAIKNSSRADDYAAYLEQFPKGRFVPLARNRQAALQKGSETASRPPTPTAAVPPVPVPPKPPTVAMLPLPTPAPAPPQPATNTAPAADAPQFSLPGSGFAAASFSPDDTFLAAVKRNGEVWIYHISTGAVQTSFKLTEPLTAVRFSPDGRHIAVATEAGETRLLQAGSGKVVWRRKPHAGRVMSLAFSPDGRYLLSAAAQGDVELSSLATGATVQRLQNDGLPLLEALYSPDGRYIAMTLGEGKSQVVRVVEVGSGRQQLLVAAAAASFSVNGRYLLAAAGGHTPTLFDIASGEELRRFARYPLTIFAGAYAESGQFVATVDAEGRGQLLDTRDGRPVARVLGLRVQPRAAAFSSDLKRFAVIDGEGRVAVYHFQEMS
jgi:uncharacterized caspase-like protein